MTDSWKGFLSYYLGNDYKKDEIDRWCFVCNKYLTQAICHLEKIFELYLLKKDTPIVDGDHPDEDIYKLTNDKYHQQY